ncbi:MAG: ABC transporter ATP-binding protein [Anderseniella sp.]|jgi:spermidine/putrescine transport system ATP-binding protein|nr:ABC transporter ATP-binding protein [Anderseniella sp.]
MADSNAPVIEFRNVTKSYGDVMATDAMSLAVTKGEFLSFLGPSGCGKTTSLRLIAGFEAPTSGDVLLDGDVVNLVPAYRRPVNMVFQHYALFPHFNVADNIAYGLRQRAPKPTAAEITRQVDEMLALVQLSGFQRRRIWEMSGGQQQRVALARALINRPKVLLLDEPLAALDRKLRREMQIELQTLQRNVGITFILVTHDQEEALSMSDRVCLMQQGRIVQIGSPRELYDRPANRYVADFVGKSNFFEGTVAKTTRHEVSVRLDTGAELKAAPDNAGKVSAGDRVSVSVRPEQMTAVRDRKRLPGKPGMVTAASVANRIFLGEHTEYLLRSTELGEFLVLSPRQNELGEKPFDIGETVQAGFSRESALVLGET